ncbi:MAG: hypothetical protein ACF8MJ_00145 [Phycisphaerales bacterium JB050]
MNPRRHGLLLLEMVIALAIFVTVGTLILSNIRQALMSTSYAKDIVRAQDLAASIIALVETELDTPENLNGPLPEWDPEEGYFGGALASASGMGFQTAGESWIIEIETAPAGVPGFTSVIVTVSREDRQGVIATRESLVPLQGASPLASGGAR